MAIALRALKTFLGRPGEGDHENRVHMGSNFSVGDQKRADYLEGKGYAAPLIKPRARADMPPANKMEPAPQNKAQVSGPLPSAGGQTGGMNPAASSSPPDRVQPARTSRRRGARPES